MSTSVASDSKSATQVVEEDIFDVLGAGSLPDAEKAELLMKMVMLIQRRTFDRIYAILTDEQRAQLESELDKTDDPDELSAIFDRFAPNYPELFENEAKKLRQELIISVTA